MAQREAGAAAGGARMAEGGAQRNAIGLTHTEAGRVVLAIWDGLRLKVTRGEDTLSPALSISDTSPVSLLRSQRPREHRRASPSAFAGFEPATTAGA
jgi:hypothetical protein